MADILIAHLKKKSGEHSSLATLASQWDFDVKLIPKALQTVGNLFPHYSRHDESHSRQILVNIERLLGTSVSLLTATDTWLILEAAYWHDIGMVVTNQDLKDALQDKEFLSFVASVRQSPNHDLFRFASSFDPTDLSKCFAGADTPADAVGCFNELMAEWFRRKHPKRAETMVNAPWSGAGISSPRTELMPARLFRVLGRICQMHGSSFEAILAADGLPFKEAGMANEDCHPRFVACLLRLGDLLDLDDNRFCPVLQRIAGDGRPATSRAHEDKHQAIRHLRIDRDRIEVSAECQTIPGYLEAFRWFDWLKQEMHSQMAHWQEIAPNRELGLLPMLGDLTVTLSGDIQILQEGQRPQFGVDEENVINLLQGGNLYNSAFPCIRELLQNAVDATLLSIWAKESSRTPREDWESPLACKHIQAAPPVEVELIESDEPAEKPDKSAEKSDKSSWRLRITDYGTGISSTDLLYMLRIGGSQKNAARQRLIGDMPEWMKPSGAFGIGLQSAFLLSDSICIKTKSIFSNETLVIEMHSPLGPNEGLVVVKRTPNDVAQAYGTTLEIKFQLDQFPQRWTIGIWDPFQNDNRLVRRLVMSMDPVLDETFPYDAGQLADEVVAFGGLSPIRVVCKFKQQNKEMETLPQEDPLIPDKSGDFSFLSNANGHCMQFQYRPCYEIASFHDSKFFYRGQPFECKTVYFPYVWFEINLLSGSAGAWLSVNRDKLAPKAVDEIKAVVLSALTQMVESDMKRYCEGSLTRPKHWLEFSLFLHAMELSEEEPWKRLAEKTDCAWMDVPVIGTSIRECFKKPEWILGMRPNVNVNVNDDQIKNCDVLIDSSYGNTLAEIAILAWERKGKGTVQVLTADELKQSPAKEAGSPATLPKVDQGLQDFSRRNFVLKFSDHPQPYYSAAAFALHLIKAVNPFGNRRYLVAIRDEDPWQELALRGDAELRAHLLMSPCASSPNVMLLPFLFTSRGPVQASQVQTTPDQLSRLYLRIQPLLASELSIERVKSLYEELIDYIDNKLMEKSAYGERWRTARRNK